MSPSNLQIDELSSGMPRAKRITGMVLLIATLACVFVLALFKIQNNDIWRHLRSGQHILDTRSIPRQDIFSYTAAGREWIYHSWLSAVVLFALYKVGGIGVIIIAKCIVIALAFAIISRIVIENKVVIPALIASILLGAFAARPMMLARPMMASLLFSAVFLYVLNAFRYRERNAIYILPVLTVLWANMHGGVVVGIMMVVIFCLGELTSVRTSEEEGWNPLVIWRNKRVRTLLIVAVLTIAAACANPYGYKVLTYATALARSSVIHSQIVEWKPPLAVIFAPFWIMLALEILLLVICAKHVSLTDIFLVLVFGSLAIGARRHISFFVILTVPVLAKYLDISIRSIGYRLKATERWPGLFAPGTQSLLNVLMIVPVGLITMVAGIGRGESFGYPAIGVADGLFPSKALEFVEQEKLEGNIYNWYDWGGYLIWNWYPERKVFVDGRVAMYGEKLYRKWADVYDAQPGWQKHLDDYDVDFILVNKGMPDALYADEDWRTIYWDDVAILLARNTPENAELVSKYDCHITNPDIFLRLRNRGQLPPEAESQLKDKIKSDRLCALAHLQLGQFYFQKARFEEAIEAFGKYVELRPDSAEAYNNIGRCYFELDEVDRAIPYYKKSLGLRPKSISGVHMNLADAYFKQGNVREATRYYGKAVAANPQSQIAHAQLANVYISRGMNRHAIKELEAALRAAEKTPGLPAQLAEKLRELTQPAQSPSAK